MARESNRFDGTYRPRRELAQYLAGVLDGELTEADLANATHRLRTGEAGA